MPTAFSSPVRENLREYQQGPRAKQKKLLERYEFREVPIDSPREIQAGDHLIRKGRKGNYYHHMLCTEGGDTDTGAEHVKIIEYTGSYSGFSASSSSVASKDLTVFGKIVEGTYTVQELLKKELFKIIWPNEIDCFPATEVIERARSRINEPCYDFLKNNCEHFVTWCKCGLNVSLQVKSWYVWARDLLYSLVAGLYDCGTKKGFVKLSLRIAVRMAEKVGKVSALSATKAGWIGFGIGCLLEIGWAIYEIYKAFKYHDKTKRELRSKLIGIAVKGGCRLLCGAGGAALGGILGPVGMLIGGALGAGLGHLLASFICMKFL